MFIKRLRMPEWLCFSTTRFLMVFTLVACIAVFPAFAQVDLENPDEDDLIEMSKAFQDNDNMKKSSKEERARVKKELQELRADTRLDYEPLVEDRGRSYFNTKKEKNDVPARAGHGTAKRTYKYNDKTNGRDKPQRLFNNVE